MQSNPNASDADAGSDLLSLWQRLDPIWQTLIWGAVGGVLVPLVVYLLIPRGSCKDPYLPKLAVDAWPFVFLYYFRWVGVFVGLLFLVRASNVRPVDLAWLNAALTVIVTAWVYYASLFAFLITVGYPDPIDQLVVDGQQFALAFCANFDLEGGHAALYLCEEEGLRSCYRLDGGLVGMGQTPTLRYEDGSLIVDDMLWGPLVYPLDGGE